ncbi:hypothetical protein BXT84_00600 [Sulfobacillus thermotolerans]|uniref:TraC-like domain-containing protein n=1 Tax=Sulfobacillus thermotolerans TaxID=338644 RepID=A0ABN5GW56_9FIRM|nr:hypothetical protein BXT84_00600 [Sulfobacillus thermotolerans]
MPKMGFPKAIKQGRKTVAPVPTPAQLTAQSWLPIQDLHDGCLIRTDGGVVAGVQIAPFSLALKSEREQESAIRGFQAMLSGLSVPWELVSLYRPTDLDSYLAALDNRTADASGPRRHILHEYARWVRTTIQSGESVERRYYLLLTRTGKDAVAEHQQTLRSLVEDAGRIRGFRVDILTDALWRELLFLLFHAAQASVEAVPEDGFRPTPLYRRKENTHG